MMDQRVKKLWIAALRSGNYAKGSGQLVQPGVKDDDRFCCLGVLCELHAQETGGAWEEARGSATGKARLKYMGQTNYLPGSVMKWAGLETQDPRANGVRLSRLNDWSKWSLEKIADHIERHL